MNKKVLFAICACVLIVAVTVCVVVQLVWLRDEMNAKDKNHQELLLNETLLNASDPKTETLEIQPEININEASANDPLSSTLEDEAPKNSTEDMSTQLIGASIGQMDFSPFVVIHAPVPCRQGYQYVAAKNKCERAL